MRICSRGWASGIGELEILQWAKEAGCPCNQSTCQGAAKAGDLVMLQWARRQACPWDQRTSAAAARYGHLEVLKWARQEGCPWDPEAVFRAGQQSGCPDVVQWLEEQKCTRVY